MESRRAVRRTRYLLITEGLYYLITGMWPLADMHSFIAVTGAKFDLWLVRTVAVLVIAIGLSVITAGIMRRLTVETAVLAATCPLSLALVEIYRVVDGVIAWAYVVDGIIEISIIIAWFYVWHDAWARAPKVDAGKGVVIGDPTRFSHRFGA